MLSNLLAKRTEFTETQMQHCGDGSVNSPDASSPLLLDLDLCHQKIVHPAVVAPDAQHQLFAASTSFGQIR